MQLKVKLKGVKEARRQLESASKRVDPVLRGALNTTATKARAERYVKPLSSSMQSKRVRGALVIKRARRGMMNSRIIPSSAGIPVIHYRSWGFDVIDKTRARIWVRGPGSRKIAAGFVNPSSNNKLPLSTRSAKTTKKGKSYQYGRRLQLAQAPSIAFWFKQLSGSQTRDWVSGYLQKEFVKRLQKELDKA
ncbi:MAG: hypothetical protein RBR43_09935 [Desulfuromonadaceae bacterium]|nr:hypothetical protein [Desulfuromonadaceae bacterium]